MEIFVITFILLALTLKSLDSKQHVIFFLYTLCCSFILLLSMWRMKAASNATMFTDPGYLLPWTTGTPHEPAAQGTGEREGVVG